MDMRRPPQVPARVDRLELHQPVTVRHLRPPQEPLPDVSAPSLPRPRNPEYRPYASVCQIYSSIPNRRARPRLHHPQRHHQRSPRLPLRDIPPHHP